MVKGVVVLQRMLVALPLFLTAAPAALAGQIQPNPNNDTITTNNGDSNAVDPFTNNGTVNNPSPNTFTNESGFTFSNANQLNNDGTFNNFGTFRNTTGFNTNTNPETPVSGVVTNTGAFNNGDQNNTGAQLNVEQGTNFNNTSTGTLANTGTVHVDGTLDNAGNFSNSGSVVVNPAGNIPATAAITGSGGTYTQTGGTTTLVGGAGITQKTVILNGGVLQGFGSVNGAVQNQAVVDGNTGGITLTGPVTGTGSYQDRVTFTGSLATGSAPAKITGQTMIFLSSVLTIQIAGGDRTKRGTDYDAIDATSVTLGGLLQLVHSPANAGFTPGVGTTYDIIDATTITGSFDGIEDLLPLPQGLEWDSATVSDGNGGELFELSVGVAENVVDEPPTVLMLVAGLVGLALRRRGIRGAAPHCVLTV